MLPSGVPNENATVTTCSNTLHPALLAVVAMRPKTCSLLTGKHSAQFSKCKTVFTHEPRHNGSLTLSSAETRVSHFSRRAKVWSGTWLIHKMWSDRRYTLLSDQTIKPNCFNFCLSKCKQKIRHEWRRGLRRYNNHHGLNAENFIFFLHLPVRRNDRFSTLFKTFCILIRSQTFVSG